MPMNIDGVRRNTIGMYAVDFKKAGKQQALPVLEKYLSILNVWHAGLVNVEWRDVK